MSEICSRPGCDNKVRSGKYYCSRRCAALDRKRLKEERRILSKASSVPKPIARQLVSLVGDAAIPILEELEAEMKAPKMMSNLTVGDDQEDMFGVIFGSGGVYRPEDALSFDRIDDMLKSGQVVFALEMKKAWIRSALRDPLSWYVDCRDEKIKVAIQALVGRVFRQHANDFMECLAYGAYFGEKEFDRQPARFWGIDGRKTYIGYRSIKPVNPRTIDRVLYTSRGEFNGYVQKVTGKDEIRVPRDVALILTHDKKFRNIWGKSALQPVYPYWVWYDIALRAFVRYLERTGTPVTVCYAPSRGQILQPDGTAMGTMKYAFLVATNVAKSNAIALPSDTDPDSGKEAWRLEYLSDDKRAAQFVDAIETLGTLIVRSLVIGDQSIEQSAVGGYASARTHLAVTMLHNEHILASLLTQINRYVVPQLVQYNFGNNAPPAIISTEGYDPYEKERMFKLISIAGNDPKSSALTKIDWKEVYRVSNIPVKDTSEEDELLDAAEDFSPEEEGFDEPSPEDISEFAGPPSDKGVVESITSKIAAGARVPIVLSPEMAERISYQKRFYIDFGGKDE